MMAPQRMLEVAPLLPVAAWYRPEHGRLYALMQELRDYDSVTLHATVYQRGADQYGGLGYVTDLSTHSVSTANLEHYAGEIVRLHRLRRAIEEGDRLVAAAYDLSADPIALLAETTATLARLAVSQGGSTWQTMATLVPEYLCQMTHGARTRVLALPWPALSEGLSGYGLEPGKVYVVAGRPAMGKSALALQMCVEVARSGHWVGMYSLEMSALEQVGRVLRSTTTEDAIAMPLCIDDTPGITLAQIGARARQLQSERGLSLLCIDYLQLVATESQRNASRAEAVGEVSRGVKLLARQLDCAVLLLAQVNRQCDSRQDRRPELGDLKESGSIEQDADVVMFVYRDEVYHEDSPDRGIAEVIIRKQRSGPTGIVRLRFDGMRTMFMDAT